MIRNTIQKKSLLSPVLVPLPLGTIRPRGWLRNQLQIQANGLSGHLDEFWPDVRDSGWIGGDSDGWERGPYWLDGLVPLAFLLGDARLEAKARHWMEYILSHQREDGWLGPIKAKRSGNWYGPTYDPWPVFVFLKALTQYAETTGEPRAIPAMTRFLQGLDVRIDETPLFEWSRYRWQDLMLSIFWLYDRAPQAWLLELAAKIHSQGFGWRAHFADFKYLDKTPPEACGMEAHAPNDAMGIKAPGVWYRFSHDPEDRESVFHILEMLDRYHGQATGMFSGDEHLAGKHPSQGIELCAVVEYMFSLEVLCSVLGESILADRLEEIAFNALPATFSPDMWAHQYDQQPNQVICRIAEDRIYTSNGPAANIFGLEPHFGCCTANMHQGWPKFVSHLWMRVPPTGAISEGLAAVAYAPCQIVTEVGETPVLLDVDTAYPFSEEVRISLRAPLRRRFPLFLRIPAWAIEASISVGNEKARSCVAGQYLRLEREWRGETTITLRLPMRPRFERRYNNAIAVHRGPLLYALKIAEEWRQIGGKLPHADWEVLPAGKWNYALNIDAKQPANSLTFERGSIGEQPFSPEGAPVRVNVKGRPVSEWKIEHNAAGTPPASPVRSDSPLEELTLIPYGCTNLRITEFPTLA